MALCSRCSGGLAPEQPDHSGSRVRLGENASPSVTSNSQVNPVDLTIHHHPTRINMPAKRKKKTRVPLRSHHPSQSSIDVVCKICHFAFDNKEWRFLPTDITTWLQEAKAEVEREAEVDGEVEIDGDFILRRNAQRDVEFRRWRLIDDPDSEASRDGVLRICIH